MLSFNEYVTEGTYGELEVAKSIIKTLRNGGFQSYLVGGCVRDTLLGRKPKDYDVATDATPTQVLALFPHADKVGAHFGVVIEKGVEIATFRSDGAYGDGRRPDEVHFEKSPREDAARRDFTVNAMFMDPFSGHVLDFFGGQEDIKHRLLRAVGDPYKRFHEDHLRMLRAVRFASKLGFSIDPDTLSAMKGLSPHIKGVAAERVTQEITGALSFAGGPEKTFSYLKTTGMLAHILPELDQLSHDQTNTLERLLAHVHQESHSFALAAMFSLLDPKVVENIAKRLKLSNDEQKHVLAMLVLQPRITASTEHTTLDVLKKLMRNPFFDDALRLYGMRVAAHDPHVHSLPFQFLTKLYAGMKQEDLHPDKFVTGNDLVALGMKPGKEFKEILDRIENGQLTGHITTKEQALSLIRTGKWRE
jgi:poly(A) polymerase